MAASPPRRPGGGFSAGAAIEVSRTARPSAPLILDLLLALALGAGHTIAYVQTGLWWLQPLAVALLAWRLQLAPPLRAAGVAGAFGTAWLGAGTWWMFVSLHRYGGLPAWMAVAAVTALCAFLSLYLAAAAAAWARFRSGRPGVDALLFAAVWLLAELARGVLLTGFPWVASGYAHVDAPLAALAPWVGVYGIGAASAGLAAWAVFGAFGRGVGRLVVPPLALGLLLAPAALPRWDFTRSTGTLGVVLLQGNVPQDEKFETRFQAEAMDWHLRALEAARGPATDLVIAPETALPLLPDQMPPGLWTSLREAFSAGRTHALVGVPLGDDASGYSNSAVGFAPGTAADRPEYRYDKHHLVPFGEFIPAGFRWFTAMMNIPLGDFRRGPLVAPSMPVAGQRVAPNICYEDLFGEELAARFTDPASAPTVLANLSNIGWFGETIAVDQHLQISRMRSLELQRPMLRATNTGATALVDHRGRVVRLLPPHTRGQLAVQAEGRSGSTPFATWAGRYALWPPALLAALVLVLAAWRRLRQEALAAAR
jgi:apolipoprotein N-acyltransferase